MKTGSVFSTLGILLLSFGTFAPPYLHNLVQKVEIFLHLNYKTVPVFSSNKLFSSNNLYCRTDAAECL